MIALAHICFIFAFAALKFGRAEDARRCRDAGMAAGEAGRCACRIYASKATSGGHTMRHESARFRQRASSTRRQLAFSLSPISMTIDGRRRISLR